jgi:hypothetical protein
MWDKEDHGFLKSLSASTWNCHLSNFCRELRVSTARQSWVMEKSCRADSDGVSWGRLGHLVTVVTAQVEPLGHVTAQGFRQNIMGLLHLSSGLYVVICPQFSCPMCSWWSQVRSCWSPSKPNSAPVLSSGTLSAVVSVEWIHNPPGKGISREMGMPYTSNPSRAEYPWQWIQSRTSSHCSWDLWPPMTQPCIFVEETKWGDFSVSPDTNLPAVHRDPGL